jgi:hypothetical protein
MAYDIRPFDAAADTGAFCCGQSNLDAYIRRYASQDVRRRVARVFVRIEFREQDTYFSKQDGVWGQGGMGCLPRPERLLRCRPLAPAKRSGRGEYPVRHESTAFPG